MSWDPKYPKQFQLQEVGTYYNFCTSFKCSERLSDKLSAKNKYVFEEKLSPTLQDSVSLFR